ncbi:hypothetical protein ALC60_08062 [Trachymyrmex zeteki]|uniref:Uncharacterized protein n=1 Tax=Mycetomoellerius zeteki TaxID=64791 RepID=A0A151WY26_9HYME|nr:hypothetical protein ALC60_08062 [Trachymyrmex zeteki]
MGPAGTSGSSGVSPCMECLLLPRVIGPQGGELRDRGPVPICYKTEFESVRCSTVSEISVAIGARLDICLRNIIHETVITNPDISVFLNSEYPLAVRHPLAIIIGGYLASRKAGDYPNLEKGRKSRNAIYRGSTQKKKYEKKIRNVQRCERVGRRKIESEARVSKLQILRKSQARDTQRHLAPGRMHLTAQTMRHRRARLYTCGTQVGHKRGCTLQSNPRKARERARAEEKGHREERKRQKERKRTVQCLIERERREERKRDRGKDRDEMRETNGESRVGRTTMTRTEWREQDLLRPRHIPPSARIGDWDEACAWSEKRYTLVAPERKSLAGYFLEEFLLVRAPCWRRSVGPIQRVRQALRTLASLGVAVVTAAACEGRDRRPGVRVVATGYEQQTPTTSDDDGREAGKQPPCTRTLLTHPRAESPG